MNENCDYSKSPTTNCHASVPQQVHAQRKKKNAKKKKRKAERKREENPNAQNISFEQYAQANGNLLCGGAQCTECTPYVDIVGCQSSSIQTDTRRPLAPSTHTHTHTPTVYEAVSIAKGFQNPASDLPISQPSYLLISLNLHPLFLPFL